MTVTRNRPLLIVPSPWDSDKVRFYVRTVTRNRPLLIVPSPWDSDKVGFDVMIVTRNSPQRDGFIGLRLINALVNCSPDPWVPGDGRDLHRVAFLLFATPGQVPAKSPPSPRQAGPYLRF